MADGTAIEWTDATWNPLRGCTRVSEGCRNCYAEVMAARFSGPGQWGEGLATMTRVHHSGKIDHRWTGKVVLVEQQLDQPLRWKRPRRIFVNSTSDLFHESVPDEWIDRIFAVMALAPQHTFQVLTKRPERMQQYLDCIDAEFHAGPDDLNERFGEHCVQLSGDPCAAGWFEDHVNWPLPNVWLGTSIEDQATADARIPHLLDTPAAVRFLSAEPLLGPVDLTMVPSHKIAPTVTIMINATTGEDGAGGKRARLDWVIGGGESGPGARPMHADWARSLRDQCEAAGVAFFYKQAGEWLHETQATSDQWNPIGAAARNIHLWDDGTMSLRIGKKAAGRLLDGREWNQMPGVRDV
jgi:protein gp37